LSLRPLWRPEPGGLCLIYAVFAVRVVDLHGYTPHLKGTVETLNGAVKSMFFAGLDRKIIAACRTGRCAEPSSWA